MIAAAHGRFSRIRQVALMCTPSGWSGTPQSAYPHRTGAAPCWVALSISTAGHVWTRSGPDLSCRSGPPSNTWFLQPIWVNIRSLRRQLLQG